MPAVELYFDFVSPYSYLALGRAESFARRHDVSWQLRPVVYGALLDATGLIGPAENDVKRRYTFRDVSRAAALLDLAMVGPPAHPFRSLEALRVVCAFGDRTEVLRLAVEIATTCWGHGRDISDIDVLAEVVERVGLPARELADRIADPEIKQVLRRHTEAALDAGVFGVPTFRVDGELFWGHDRLPQLAAYLSGELPAVADTAAAMEQRPRAADRKSAAKR